MSKKQVAIIGSSGRMGTELIRLLKDDDQLQFAVGVSRTPGPQTKLSMEQLDSKSIDIVVDFSLPEVADKTIAWCLANKKPLVSGVTGVSDLTKQNYIKASQKLAVLWAPNMSLGIAILNKTISELPTVSGFEYRIEETHHLQKKDRPSGTAILLQNTLEARLGKKLLPPTSIREGEVFGIHKIFMTGAEEVLTFEHKALSRSVFAKGALAAAKWILNKPAGCYQMTDVLGV